MHDCAVRPCSTNCLLCVERPFQKVNQSVRVLDKEVGRNRAKPSRILKRSYWHVNSRSSICNISLPIENRGSSQWDLPGAVFFVAHMFQPVDKLPITPFLNRDVRHGRGRRSPMPML